MLKSIWFFRFFFWVLFLNALMVFMVALKAKEVVLLKNNILYDTNLASFRYNKQAFSSYDSGVNFMALEESKNIDKTKSKYQHVHDKEAYLIVSTSVTVSLMVVGVGVLYALPESVTNWDKDEINGIFGNWRENVTSGPVMDKDDFFLNYVTHPYWGAIYYMQARNAGYGYLGSFVYSSVISTLLWEYGVEAFAEVPSVQDLIITPVVGSLMGEGFYYLSNMLKDNLCEGCTNWPSYILLTLMDPGFVLIENTPLHKFVIVDSDKPITTFDITNNKMLVKLNLYLK